MTIGLQLDFHHIVVTDNETNVSVENGWRLDGTRLGEPPREFSEAGPFLSDVATEALQNVSDEHARVFTTAEILGTIVQPTAVKHVFTRLVHGLLLEPSIRFHVLRLPAASSRLVESGLPNGRLTRLIQHLATIAARKDAWRTEDSVRI
eukprot:2232163-Pyramimonas_sp.AAC.1